MVIMKFSHFSLLYFRVILNREIIIMSQHIIIIRRIKIMPRHNKNSEFLLCLDIILIHRNIIMLRYNFNSLFSNFF